MSCTQQVSKWGVGDLGTLPLLRCHPMMIPILGVCVRAADRAVLTGREANGS
jgi:hypothetical protein